MIKNFKTRGTCATMIDIETTDDGIIKSVKFHNGCAGNTMGISKLVVGRKAAEVSELLRGVRCGAKKTSCPDQLAKALDEMVAGN